MKITLKEYLKYRGSDKWGSSLIIFKTLKVFENDLAGEIAKEIDKEILEGLEETYIK